VEYSIFLLKHVDTAGRFYLNRSGIKVMTISSVFQGGAAYPAPVMYDPASFIQKAGVGTTSNALKRYPN
jgi:hypothetical protein